MRSGIRHTQEIKNETKLDFKHTVNTWEKKYEKKDDRKTRIRTPSAVYLSDEEPLEGLLDVNSDEIYKVKEFTSQPMQKTSPASDIVIPQLIVHGDTPSDSRILTSVPNDSPLGARMSGVGPTPIGYVHSTDPHEDTIFRLFESMLSRYANMYRYYVEDHNGIMIDLGVQNDQFANGDRINSIPGYESIGPVEVRRNDNRYLVM
jgi:hypothetical protein